MDGRLRFLFSFFLITVFSLSANAQSISITGPANPVAVIEGDDYATNQLQNPWDFNQRRDIGWEENYSGTSISAENGVWSATNASTGAYFFPLFGGFKGGLFTEGVHGDQSLPQFGINTPIDSSRYTQLAFRLNTSSRSTQAVYWNNNPSVSHWPDGSNNGARFDGFGHFGVGNAHSGFVLYTYDMKSLSSQFEQSSGSWSGDIIALRIDPSSGAPAGTNTSVDWIRLVDPGSAPGYTLTWSSSGLSANELVVLYVDTDASGYDGTPMAWFSDGSNPGSYTINTAIFPPGDYYFYLVSFSGSSNLVQEAASGYSPRLSVNSAPSVNFLSPTEVTGEDYASVTIDDPWDMSGASDVDNLEGSTWPYEWRQFSSASFNQGVFQAVADVPLSGATETDVQVHLNINPLAPIDTSKYRYLTYRLAVDETNYPTISDKVEEGWVSRPVFWDNSLFGDGGRPKAHVIYEGWNTYTIDLWESGIIEAGNTWQAKSSLKHLRLDLLETNIPTWFFLDWVRLSAENRAPSGTFVVEWTVADSDSSTFTSSLYYDTDDSGFDGQLITTIENHAAGDRFHRWDTSGLNTGQAYYLYLVVSDGVNTKRLYSPVRVVVGAYTAAPRSGAAPFDYDGDGTSDQVVYRQNAGGIYYTNRSTNGFSAINWGGANFVPIEGDFDADGISDHAVVVDNGGFLYWYILRSSDNATDFRQWGLTGDELVVADYNGDGADDVSIYRQGLWYILYRDGTVAVHAWGLPGDVPVPRDYDRDGTDDIAIWRPSDGMWWIINSGFSSGNTAEAVTVVQWGLNGDTPVPGDYDGDGSLELAVWRYWNGTWYVREIGSDQTIVQQWGLPGDIPVVGDFNGDGSTDFSVFRPGVAFWFHNFGGGSTSAIQWGLPSDLLPQDR